MDFSRNSSRFTGKDLSVRNLCSLLFISFSSFRCGFLTFWTVLRIRDVHPGSESFSSRIRFFSHPGSRGLKGTGSWIRVHNTVFEKWTSYRSLPNKKNGDMNTSIVGIVFLTLDVLLQILLGQGTLRPDLIESASELATTGTCISLSTVPYYVVPRWRTLLLLANAVITYHRTQASHMQDIG